MFSREKMLRAVRTRSERASWRSRYEWRRMKSIGNAGAERLLSSSFQLSRLLFSPPSLCPVYGSELEHGRSSSGPISLNSRGVREVCEMAVGSPEVRRGRRGGRRVAEEERRRTKERGNACGEKKVRLEFAGKIYRVLPLASAAIYFWIFIFDASSLLISRSRRHVVLRE